MSLAVCIHDLLTVDRCEHVASHAQMCDALTTTTGMSTCECVIVVLDGLTLPRVNAQKAYCVLVN